MYKVFLYCSNIRCLSVILIDNEFINELPLNSSLPLPFLSLLSFLIILTTTHLSLTVSKERRMPSRSYASREYIGDTLVLQTWLSARNFVIMWTTADGCKRVFQSCSYFSKPNVPAGQIESSSPSQAIIWLDKISSFRFTLDGPSLNETPLRGSVSYVFNAGERLRKRLAC